MEEGMKPGRGVAGHGTRIAMVLAAVVAGCGDGEPASSPEPGAVLARSDEASRQECPHGGTAVSSGLDRNRNGQLDEDEVKTRTLLCRDAPAVPEPKVVLRLVAEPAGPHCAEGGTAVQSGRDVNGNHRLDDDEVEHTDYVCDAELLTRVRAEEAGANCVAGGVAFQIGRDRDNDGALADGEVEWTEYECSEVLDRDVRIATAQEADALARIKVITGDLQIDHFVGASPGAEVALPALQHIGGSLLVQFNYLAKPLSALRLPALTQVDGSVLVEHNVGIAELETPALRQIGGRLRIYSNYGLPAVGLAALERIGGAAEIIFNDSLTSVSLFEESAEPFGLTEIVGPLEIGFNERLTHIGSGAKIVHAVYLHNNDALASLTFASTRAGRVDISQNPALGALRVQVPILDSLFISSNDDLRELEIATAEVAGDVLVSSRIDGETISEFTVKPHYPSSTEPVKIGGALTIFAPIKTFHSPTKVRVLGACGVAGTRLSSLHALERVDGRLLLSTNSLLTEDISPFPVGGGFSIYRNPLLRSLAFLQPSSQQLEVFIVENASLTDLASVASDVLVVSGTFWLADNAALAEVPNIRVNSIGGRLLVYGNPLLPSVKFPFLRSVDQGVDVHDSASVASVQLPLLARTSYLKAWSNPLLVELQVPALTQLQALTVFANPAFPSCSLAALCAQLPAGSCQVAGNDDDATCQ